MSKKIEATLGERVAAISVLNEGKFSNSGLAAVLDDIKKLAITPEEWTAADLTKTPSDAEVAALPEDKRANVQQTWKWNETGVTELELGQETVDFLHTEIKRRGDASELKISDGNLISLDKKLTQ